MAVNPIPEGYNTVTPSLIVDGAEGLLEFIGKAFDGQVRLQMPRADGGVMHAEIVVAGSAIMVGDSSPEYPAVQNASLHVYVENVDGVYQKALDAGATSLQEPQLMFYGDRTAEVRDQWGIRWAIATHVEDVSEEEITKRLAEQYQLPAGG